MCAWKWTQEVDAWYTFRSLCMYICTHMYTYMHVYMYYVTVCGGQRTALRNVLPLPLRQGIFYFFCAAGCPPTDLWTFWAVPCLLFTLSLGIMGLQMCHTSSLYHRDLFCGSWGSKSAHLAFAPTVFSFELSPWTPFLRQVLIDLEFINWPINCQQAAGSHLPPLSSSSSGSQTASLLLFFLLGHWEPKLRPSCLHSNDFSSSDHPSSQFWWVLI